MIDVRNEVQYNSSPTQIRMSDYIYVYFFLASLRQYKKTNFSLKIDDRKEKIGKSINLWFEIWFK